MARENAADMPRDERPDATSSPSAILYYLDILRRRVWVILPIVLISTTLGLLKAFRAPKLYRATARLLVERVAPSVMRFEEGLTERAGWDPDFYTTQAQLVRSRSVMELALRNPGVQELFARTDAAATPPPTSWLSELRATLLAVLGAAPASPPEPWQMVRAQVSAAHIPETHFIEVRVVDRDPHRAALLANATAQAFQDYHRQRKVELLGEAFDMLQKEKDKQEAELLKAEKELQAFRETAKGVAMDREKGDQPAVDRLVKLNDQLTEVQIERIKLSSELEVIREALQSQAGLSRRSEELLFSIPAVQTDGNLSAARKSLADAEKELATLSETYGAEHPRLVAARTRLTVLREQFKKSLSEILESQSLRLKALETQEAELHAQYEEQRRATVDLAKEEFAYTRLQNAVDRHRRLFDAIVERMREVDVSSGLAKTNVQIVDAAAPPTAPLGAGKARTLLLALLVGLCLGGALALVAENVDDTIKTPEDLRERAELPLLGFVPTMDTETVEPASGAGAEPTAKTRSRSLPRRLWTPLRRLAGEVLPLAERPVPVHDESGRSHRGRVILTEPLSSTAEAYRNIRASLFYSTPADEVRLLAVTSCQPQEGKTTTLTNLALCIAQTGKRVLVVDADLHRPAVDRTLGVETRVGLTSVLVGETALEDAVRPVLWQGTPVEYLDVLAAGPPSPNPSELLSSTRMKELLARVRQSYEWVLVDTPPVLFVSDARTVSVLCDGVVLVVKAGSATRSLVARAREQLDSVRARVIGAILNDVRVSKMGRRYSTYASYGYARYARDYKRHYYRHRDEDAERRERPASSASRPAPSRPAERLTPLDQARLHLDAGNPGRARSLLEEHTETHPEDVEAWELLIEIAVREKDPAALSATLERFRAARGEHGHVYAFGRAHLELLKGHWKAAREGFEEASAIRPDHVPSLEGLLRAMLPEHEPRNLRERARQLLERDPRHPFAHYVEGMVRLAEGDKPGAEEAFRRSLEAAPQLEALNDLAWLLQEKGELAEAEKMARAALELDGRSAAAWDTLGVILMRRDRLTEAEAALARACKLSNGYPPFCLRFAQLQQRLGHREEVARLAQQIARKKKTLSAADAAILSDLDRWLNETESTA